MLMAYPAMASGKTCVMLSSPGQLNASPSRYAKCGDGLWRFPHGLQIHNICFAPRRLESPSAIAKNCKGTYESHGGGPPAGGPWEHFERAIGNRGCCRGWPSLLCIFIVCASYPVRLAAVPFQSSRSDASTPPFPLYQMLQSICSVCSRASRS